MKSILLISFVSLLLFSCQKEKIETTRVLLTKIVTIDFRQISDMQPVISFKNLTSQGVFTFNITDGQLQTKQLPAIGKYVISYSFLDCDPGCIMNAEAGIKFYEIPYSTYSVTDTLDGEYVMTMACNSMPAGRK